MQKSERIPQQSSEETIPAEKQQRTVLESRCGMSKRPRAWREAWWRGGGVRVCRFAGLQAVCRLEPYPGVICRLFLRQKFLSIAAD